MLGIFRTKKAEYNKLILKSLVTGPKITKEVAEYIYFNRKQQPKLRLRKTKEPNGNEVKSIVSIISRKNARFDELERLHYIFRENNLWNLTVKGACVALTQFNSIMEIFSYIKVDLALDGVEKEIYKNPMMRMLMTYYTDKDEIRKIFKFGKSPEFLQLWKDYTNELRTQGVDLDKMSDREFRLLIANKAFEHLFRLKVSKLEKTFLKITEKRESEGV